MLNFHTPSLEEADEIRKLVFRTKYMGNELTFANMYLLRDKYGINVAVQDGILYRYYEHKGARLYGYGFPVTDSSDVREALDLIVEDANISQRELVFTQITQGQKQVLSSYFDGHIRFATVEGDWDYIYLQRDLATLVGRKNAKKRNHIRQFAKEVGDCNFDTLNDDNRDDFMRVEEKWFAAKSIEHDSDAILEKQEIEEALSHREALGMEGLILYVDSTPVAISLFSRLTSETCDIHFEKAIPEYRIAYPVINQQTAMFLQDATFINREEDVDIPGLRKAKKSYYPIEQLKKYFGSVCSDAEINIK